MQKFKNKIQENRGLKAIVKFLCFLGLLFILDFGAGNILRYFYFKQSSGFLYNTTYAIDSTIEDVIILGSSYAHRHYVPEAFEKRLGMSVYNAGRDGNYIFYQYAILKGILKRYSPKKVILDFNFEGFKKDEISYESASSLLPYYKSHPEIRYIINMRSPFEKYKHLSKVYPFNSLIFAIGVGNLEYNKTHRKMSDDRGYMPLFEVWNKPIITDTVPIKYELDSNKINIFKSFILDCLDHHVELYIVVSSRYEKHTHKDPSLVLANKIANEFNVRFYNLLNAPEIINDPSYFANPTHLNNSGAKTFSGLVLDRILQADSAKLSMK